MNGIQALRRLKWLGEKAMENKTEINLADEFDEFLSEVGAIGIMSSKRRKRLAEVEWRELTRKGLGPIQEYQSEREIEYFTKIRELDEAYLLKGLASGVGRFIDWSQLAMTLPNWPDFIWPKDLEVRKSCLHYNKRRLYIHTNPPKYQCVDCGWMWIEEAKKDADEKEGLR